MAQTRQKWHIAHPLSITNELQSESERIETENQNTNKQIHGIYFIFSRRELTLEYDRVSNVIL